MRRILTPLFRHGDQQFDHSLPLAKGPRNWYTKVVDNRAQSLGFEVIPRERVLAGHDSRGGDGSSGGGVGIRRVVGPAASIFSRPNSKLGCQVTRNHIHTPLNPALAVVGIQQRVSLLGILNHRKQEVLDGQHPINIQGKHVHALNKKVQEMQGKARRWGDHNQRAAICSAASSAASDIPSAANASATLLHESSTSSSG